MIRRNREGYDSYYIDSDWHEERDEGISAMLRVGNEEEWIGPCLESILDFFDEIVITIDCDDRTMEVIETFASPKITVYEYPFDINSNGPGHDGHPENSVHDRAYYYNWSLAQTTKTHVSKWDADMLLLPEYATSSFREAVLNNNVVKMSGWEVVDERFEHISAENPTTGKEVRFFEVRPNLHYEQGALCERFTYPSMDESLSKPRLALYRLYNVLTGNELHVPDPTYLHTKHIKSSDKQAWPDDWREKKHFQGIEGRKRRGASLEGTPPEFCFRTPESYLSDGKGNHWTGRST